MSNTTSATRHNFASAIGTPAYPDFLDIQIKSFQDFFQLETKSDERGNEGLYNTFMENFPISDSRNQFVLEFLDYFVDPPRYSIQTEIAIVITCRFFLTWGLAIDLFIT